MATLTSTTRYGTSSGWKAESNRVSRRDSHLGVSLSPILMPAPTPTPILLSIKRIGPFRSFFSKPERSKLVPESNTEQGEAEDKCRNGVYLGSDSSSQTRPNLKWQRVLST